jgi:hypothetical protein
MERGLLFAVLLISIGSAFSAVYLGNENTDLKQRIELLEARADKQGYELLNVRLNCDIAVKDARKAATDRIAALIDLINGGQALVNGLMMDVNQLSGRVKELDDLVKRSIRPMEDKVTALAKSVKYMEQQLVD